MDGSVQKVEIDESVRTFSTPLTFWTSSTNLMFVFEMMDTDQTEKALELLRHPEKIREKETQQWLSHKENSRLYEELRRYTEAGLRQEAEQTLDTEAAYDYFMRRLHSRRNLRIRRLSAVAAICTLLLTAGWLWVKEKNAEDHFESMTKLPVASTIQPGKNQAILTTETGEKFALGETNAPKMEIGKGIKISYDTLKGIQYETDQLSQVHTHTLRTPAGGEYRLLLADGTTVWLNAESELTYPTSFTGENREVELRGEAYFSVSENKNQPFIVHTNGVKTRVYGTEFNIRSYLKEEINITLVKGSISVCRNNSKQEHMLQPGENACLKVGKTPEISRVNIHKYIAWKEGYFYYENERLGNILEELGRWYDFDVVYVNPQLSNLRFELWADRDSEINSVISLLSKTNKIQIKTTGRTLVVSQHPGNRSN